ncbi:MAG: DNA mismatch repair endonuclease MutL [Acidobacteria bacterium]|nr:DNA mismatch repair endonuclease MutL [Acidobacteriota bacterium]
MGRIHVLPEHIANKIAAGEVVERPASVVKELLENSLDAGSRHIRLQLEAGGKKLIRISDDGCGMVRDDALLAFERHATSKIRNAEDLTNVATLGFRGEALPSIASVSRLRLDTRVQDEDSGTTVEIAGGKILRVEEAGLPPGTSITVRDLFFNTPARRKFLKSESTELSHIASLVTHYALAHPETHFELHSTTNAILVAPPVGHLRARVYQVFGKDVLEQLIPISAELPLARAGLPAPPPWKRTKQESDGTTTSPGSLRLDGFVSKPEVQKLNRGSIYTFVNSRLVRDRSIQHALSEAYRNVIPPTVFPVVLLFLHMPHAEVDVNVHPSKTEIRFRQQAVVHDFIRDAVRSTMVKARPVPGFVGEIRARPTATPALAVHQPTAGAFDTAQSIPGFLLELGSPASTSFHFIDQIQVKAGSTNVSPQILTPPATATAQIAAACDTALAEDSVSESAASLATLKPLGQLRDSFILAVNQDALWIIDQHVAHERILFEKVLRQRAEQRVESQRLLMPILIELNPAQQAVLRDISEELEKNGFEVEPFGARSIAVKVAPSELEASELEHILHELLEQFCRQEQALNLEQVRRQIAASIACHAAIKVNMTLEASKMEWLLRELAKTDCPMACPHGRPVVLRYSMKEIQKAFKRI